MGLILCKTQQWVYIDNYFVIYTSDGIVSETVRTLIHRSSFFILFKKFKLFLDLCVSSLRRIHANILCIVPILSYVSEETTLIHHGRLAHPSIFVTS